MGGLGSERPRNGSILTKVLSHESVPSAEMNQQERHRNAEGYPNGSMRPPAAGSPSKSSLPSSLNQKTPARSYFQRSLHESHGIIAMYLGARD